MDRETFKKRSLLLFNELKTVLEKEESGLVLYVTLNALIAEAIANSSNPKECLKDFIKNMTETLQYTGDI